MFAVSVTAEVSGIFFSEKWIWTAVLEGLVLGPDSEIFSLVNEPQLWKKKLSLKKNSSLYPRPNNTLFLTLEGTWDDKFAICAPLFGSK